MIVRPEPYIVPPDQVIELFTVRFPDPPSEPLEKTTFGKLAAALKLAVELIVTVAD